MLSVIGERKHNVSKKMFLLCASSFVIIIYTVLKQNREHSINSSLFEKQNVFDLKFHVRPVVLY